MADIYKAWTASVLSDRGVGHVFPIVFSSAKSVSSGGILPSYRDGCHQHKKWKGFAKVREVERVWSWHFSYEMSWVLPTILR
jgi:hypothetical protein